MKDLHVATALAMIAAASPGESAREGVPLPGIRWPDSTPNGKVRHNWDQRQAAKKNRMEKRRAKNKAAKQARKRNRQ